MAHVRLLQDWTTIQVPASGTVAQDEAHWLDLTNYDDLVVWSQVRTSTNISLLETGAMNMVFTVTGTVSAKGGNAADSIVFNLSTWNPGGFPLDKDLTDPDKASGFLTGQGTPAAGGPLAGESATFTAEVAISKMFPSPRITPQ